MIDKQALRSIGIGAGLMGFALFLIVVIYAYKTTLEIQNIRLDNKLMKRQLNESA